jgi:hypothetical protein
MYGRDLGVRRFAGVLVAPCFAQTLLHRFFRSAGMNRVGPGDRAKGCASPRLIVYSATTEGARVTL